METTERNKKVSIKIEKINSFKGIDLDDLCDATERTILDDSLSFSIGLKRTDPLMRDRLESYWKGVILVPERQLIVGRVDNVIASAIQLVKPSPSNQTSSFCGYLENHFVSPWARGHGLAAMLIKAAEEEALNSNLYLLRLSVRSNLANAIRLYESHGYIKWGTLDKYEKVDGRILSGYFYYKDLHTN